MLHRLSIVRAILAVSFLLSSGSLLAEDNQTQFAGLGFGVGLSLTVDFGGHDRVIEATIDKDRIVRILKEKNKIPRVLLESHYFKANNKDNPTMGWGPFIALQPGTDQVIDAIGMGLMIGLKRNDDKNDKSSFNLGLGYISDPSVKILGDGIKKNQALPDGDTEIRYKETSQSGVLFFASFTF